MSEPLRFPDRSQRETRLGEIRRQAENGAPLKVGGTPPAGAPFPKATPETGYYGIPLLKEPPWTWEIPLYFFVGGAAGAAAVIGAIADYTGADRQLVRHARWIAAAGSVISPALLISDLGRPERFLAMLRVFKPQSPMSVGVWTMTGFSAATTAANAGAWMRARSMFPALAALLEGVGDVTALAF